MIQNIDCPTHKDGNMIDLVFTNNSDLIHNLTVIPAPNSDHYLINCSAVYSRATEPKENEPKNNENRNEEFSFHHLNFFDDTVNWDSLCDELSQYNWSREFRGMDTTGMMKRFTSVCLQIAQKWVPVRKAPPHAHHNRPKIPRHRRALMRRRTQLKKRYISAKTEINRQALLQKLIHIEKDLQKSHCDQPELEERRAIEKIKTNPKFFFTFGKKFSKIKIGVGPLMNTAKKLIAAPTKMAEMLSRAGVKYVFVFVFVFKYANICICICICIWKPTRWNICICIWLAYLGVFEKYFSNTLFFFTLGYIMIIINIISCIFHNS